MGPREGQPSGKASQWGPPGKASPVEKRAKGPAPKASPGVAVQSAFTGF
jgi:hypothetical protein